MRELQKLQSEYEDEDYNIYEHDTKKGNTTIGNSSKDLSSTVLELEAPSTTQRSSLEILRRLGIKHDKKHELESEDYLTGHNPINEDYSDEYSYDDYDDYDNETSHEHHNDSLHYHHSHLAPDGFFCSFLGNNLSAGCQITNL